MYFRYNYRSIELYSDCFPPFPLPSPPPTLLLSCFSILTRFLSFVFWEGTYFTQLLKWWFILNFNLRIWLKDVQCCSVSLCLSPIEYLYNTRFLEKFNSDLSHVIVVWYFNSNIKKNYLFYLTILYLFCHTLTWILHGCTCVPHPELPSHHPPHPIPLGHPSAPALSTCLMHQTWTGDLFHIW